MHAHANVYVRVCMCACGNVCLSVGVLMSVRVRVVSITNPSAAEWEKPRGAVKRKVVVRLMVARRRN